MKETADKLFLFYSSPAYNQDHPSPTLDSIIAQLTDALSRYKTIAYSRFWGVSHTRQQQLLLADLVLTSIRSRSLSLTLKNQPSAQMKNSSTQQKMIVHGLICYLTNNILGAYQTAWVDKNYKNSVLLKELALLKRNIPSHLKEQQCLFAFSQHLLTLLFSLKIQINEAQKEGSDFQYKQKVEDKNFLEKHLEWLMTYVKKDEIELNEYPDEEIESSSLSR